MDEERRTGANLTPCISAVRDWIAFLSTSFLDRAGDEMPILMRAGLMVHKGEMKGADRIRAHEDRNVPIGLARGQGRSGRMRMRPLLALMLAVLPGMVSAQTSAIHRQPLETADFPGNGLHTVVMRTTIDPAGVIAPHIHAGLEMAYVAAGTVTVTIGDAPPREVAAGGSFQVAPRTRHSVRNSGSEPAVVVSTYIVDPAAPLATPAP